MDADPLETDFSDIGAAGPPSALGDFLGASPAKRSSTQTGYDDVPVAIDADAIDEEDVYTSASRQRARASRATIFPGRKSICG